MGLKVYAPDNCSHVVQAQSAFVRIIGPGSLADLHKATRIGFPAKVVTSLGRELEMEEGGVLRLLHLSPSTFRRRLTLARGKHRSARLSSPESDRVFRLVNLLEKATELFAGDQKAAARWLNSPVRALGNETPLHYADTEAGLKMVLDVIGRLEYGVVT